jgi:hypothetical protein
MHRIVCWKLATMLSYMPGRLAGELKEIAFGMTPLTSVLQMAWAKENCKQTAESSGLTMV